MKDASLSEHDRFSVHDERTVKEIDSLHDEIENESNLESHFDIYEADVDRKEKRITTTSRVKEH
jgi:hypothetical protein